MSDFEFLARIPIGQYVPGNSLLHRLDPRAKIIFFTMLVLAFALSQSLAGLVIGLIFMIAWIIISGIDLKFALKSVFAPLPIIILVAILQVVFYSAPEGHAVLISFWRIQVTLDGIIVGSILIVRFAALILTISLATFCISTSELIQGLQRLLSPLNKLKIKTMDLVMVVQITFRFVPLLAQTAERIAKAQASRGADWGGKTKGLVNRVKQMLPLLVPLFITSLHRAENLAIAMDARAYGFLDNRSSMVEMKLTRQDAFIIMLNAIVSLFILFA